MKSCKSVVAFLVYLVLLTEYGFGQRPDSLPGVKANLVISVEEYDPFTPSKAVVICTVVNNSPDAVELFLGIDNRNTRLFGSNRPRPSGPDPVLRMCSFHS